MYFSCTTVAAATVCTTAIATIAAFATAADTAAAIAVAAATNAVSVAIPALLVDCCVPPHCHSLRCRCLLPPLPLLAADFIGDGGNCGNGCGGKDGSGNCRAFRSFSGVMFKILHIKSNILNIKLDKEGGGCRMGWTSGSIRGGEDAPLAPWPHSGSRLCLHCPS
jgi:hypothetical protein